MRKILSALFMAAVLSSGVCAIEPFPGLTQKRKSEFKNFMHTGFAFDAVLKTAIFSFNIETPVIALVEYDVIFGDKVVLPSGTKLIGATSIIKSINRVNVVFNTIVLPNGDEFNFTGLALHTDGSAGIPGKVKKEAMSIPARVLLEAAGAGASAASPVAGSAVKELSAAAKEELAQSQKYSISIKKDTPVMVYVVQRTE
ncbi:MAG: TrbI/VirB10 family protein, partial [Endomicrobiia bacterium]|nr:TrbI/VirB10 family protein [Endomicrobiia bacterium]